MYENEIEIEYIDVEGMRFLEGIEPFPEIVEALEDIAANNLFMQNRKPWIEIRDPRPADEGSFSEDNARLPNMQLHVLDAGTSMFELHINLEGCRYTPSGNTVETAFIYSRFRQMFHISGALRVTAIKTDIKSIARMVTYYLRLFGYVEDDCWISRNMYFTTGVKQRALVADGLRIPETLARAIKIVKALKLDYDDFVWLRLSAPDGKNLTEPFELQVNSYAGDYSLDYSSYFQDRAEMQRRMRYRNSDCLEWMMEAKVYSGSLTVEVNERKELLLLLDYFLFLNPGITLEDIVVSLDFSICYNNFRSEQECMENPEFGSLIYSFYPDGTLDPGDKLLDCAWAVYSARRNHQEWIEAHPEAMGYE